MSRNKNKRSWKKIAAICLVAGGLGALVGDAAYGRAYSMEAAQTDDFNGVKGDLHFSAEGRDYGGVFDPFNLLKDYTLTKGVSLVHNEGHVFENTAIYKFSPLGNHMTYQHGQMKVIRACSDDDAPWGACGNERTWDFEGVKKEHFSYEENISSKKVQVGEYGINDKSVFDGDYDTFNEHHFPDGAIIGTLGGLGAAGAYLSFSYKEGEKTNKPKKEGDD